MTSRTGSDLRFVRLGRRRFLALSGAALALPGLARGAWAHGSETHVFPMGDIEVTVVSDGHLVIPTSVIAANLTGAEHDAAVAEVLGSVQETFQPETNHALLRAGSDLVLVDTGSGPRFQPSAGKLLANLAFNGIDPGDVTKVVFTHAHPDHVWGTLLEDDKTLAFPNAEYFVGSAKFDFWTAPDIFTVLPADFHPFAEGAQRDLMAVTDRLTMVREGDAIVPGVTVIDTPGHTPGHVSLFVEGEPGLIITGDVIGDPAFNVSHPDWVFGFDFDPEMAIATRRSLLGRAAADGNQILSYHAPYPGVGTVAATDDGAFAFTAVS